MATVQSTICDICGKKKEETNHWWKFWTIRLGSKLRMVISHADDTGTEMPSDNKDACSETCASVAFSRWMSTGSFGMSTTGNTQSISNDVQTNKM